MNSNSWKLVMLAGLVWLAVLLPEDFFDFPAFSESPPQPAAELATPEIETPVPPPTASLPAAPAISPTPPPPTPTASATVTPTPRPVLHAVEPGEMPLSIAAAYDIDVSELLAVNDITDPSALQIGQQLIIPVTPTPRSTATPAEPAASPEPTEAPVYHIVEEGESPLAIAAEYDLTVEALMIANDIIDPTSLQIGQELLIPPDKGSPLGVRTVIHEINSGDTLLGLAGRYGSTVEDIVATNPDLEPTSLQVGQPVVVPLTQPDRANWPANTPPKPAAPRITSPAPSPPGLLGVAERMFQAINAERQAYGLAPYAKDPQLTLVAEAHAQDMAARGYLSHVTPEGLTVRDRLSAQGLALNWVGENIIRSIRSAEETPSYATNWFMNDRPHRANILHNQYTRVGVGVAQEPSGWYSLVLVFAGDS